MKKSILSKETSKKYTDLDLSSLISTSKENEPKAIPTKIASPPPEEHHVNPAYVENKTRRVQLMLKPSLYEKAKEEAASRGTSLNELINLLLTDRYNGGKK